MDITNNEKHLNRLEQVQSEPFNFHYDSSREKHSEEAQKYLGAIIIPNTAKNNRTAINSLASYTISKFENNIEAKTDPV